MLLNYRAITKNISISGGYQDVERALDFCVYNNIKSIIDLQFIDPQESSTARRFIMDECKKRDIRYHAVFMRDDELNPDLDNLLETVYNLIYQEMEDLGNHQRILIKCATGISLSATVLIYCLCKGNEYTYTEALEYIRSREQGQTQFGASPHPYFAQYLSEMFPDEWENE